MLDGVYLPTAIGGLRPLLWLRDSNRAARQASAGVTCRLRFQIVCFFVHDDGMTNDGVDAVQLHQAVGQFQVRFSAGVGFDVAKIAGVTITRVWRAMLFVPGIEMTASRCGLRIGTISKLVNVESVFTGSQSADIGDNFHVIARCGESDSARDIAAGG